MAFEHEGLEATIAVLKRAAMLPVECNRELHLAALETQQTAKHMAPVDYADLQNAIQMRARNSSGQFAKLGSVMVKMNYEIFVNDNHPVSDPKKIKAGVSKVSAYSRQVHEYMGWGNTPGASMGNGKAFMPSEESVRAGLEHGVDAGGRFIDRAAEKTRETLHARLGTVILRASKTR